MIQISPIRFFAIVKRLSRKISIHAGTTVIGPLALWEKKREKCFPLWVVCLVSLCVSLGPPYALLGLLLSGVASSGVILVVFAAKIALAIVIMIAFLLRLLLHIKEKPRDQHPPYAFDVVVELKVKRLSRQSIRPS